MHPQPWQQSDLKDRICRSKIIFADILDNNLSCLSKTSIMELAVMKWWNTFKNTLLTRFFNDPNALNPVTLLSILQKYLTELSIIILWVFLDYKWLTIQDFIRKSLCSKKHFMQMQSEFIGNHFHNCFWFCFFISEWRSSWGNPDFKTLNDAYTQIVRESVPIELDGHKHQVECLSCDGNIIVSLCLGGSLNVWDSYTGEQISETSR